MESKSPAISVIMATYNRSNILPYSIGSLLNQSYKDFELLVVDDASTDDTIEVINSFRDERIRLVCLEENRGNQAEPNNIGLNHAKGRYIAYLNQDDLYFPDHLEKMVNCIEQDRLDWVYAYAIDIISDNLTIIDGIHPGDSVEPFYGTVISASTWMIRKEVVIALGGWRLPHTIRIASSQDLLIRGLKARIKLRPSQYVTVLIIPSGNRKNSYSDRHSAEQKYYFEQMMEQTSFKEDLYLKAFISYRKYILKDSISIRKAIHKLFGVFLRKISRLTGISALQIYFCFFYPQKGSFINQLRKTRGLAPLP